MKTTVEARLATTRFVTDERTPHLEVNQILARATGTGRLLVAICPARVFAETSEGITVDHAACLECGACLAVAPPGTLRWTHPRGGFGIAYREG